MRERNKKPIMWTLYGVLFLVMCVLQTTLLGDVTLFTAKFSLMPTLIACVAMIQGAERGGIYALACGFFWYCSGADGTALPIITFTVCGIVIGWLGENFLVRSFLSALLVSLGATVFCQGALLAVKCYLGGANAGFVPKYLIGAAISLIACPILYPVSCAIGRIYKEQKI